MLKMLQFIIIYNSRWHQNLKSRATSLDEMCFIMEQCRKKQQTGELSASALLTESPSLLSRQGV